MKKTIQISFNILLAFFLLESCSPNYNRIMGKSIKSAIGSDLKGYQVFSYPTDNFGLITSYENSVSDANFLCDMWNCIGVATPSTIPADWMQLNNFAGVGTGGTIELSEKKKNKVAADVILPKIYDVVGVTGGFKKERTTEINITIGKAYLRKLRRDEIIQFINGLDNTKSIKKAYNNGNLILVVADCVIENMSVSVKVDDETSAKLDAKLGVPGPTVASRLFQDASLSVNVERTSTGAYTFKIIHPVIFARLPKKQPSAGSLGAGGDFSDWLTIESTLDKSLLKNFHP